MATQKSKGTVELKKGPWTRDEDKILITYIQQHGHGGWRTLPEKAGLERCGKSCRLRWTNYLRPDIKRGKFSNHEEKSIIRLHALLGNKWSAIAAYLPNRTDNEIKNYWNTRLKKRLTRMGIDPTTHKPKNSQPGSATVMHMAQWEAARLEAEARLVRESKRVHNHHILLHRATAPPPPLPCLDVLKVWKANTLGTSFFNLESPTSTLNFSCSNSVTVPAIREEENTVVSTHNNGGEGEWYAEMKGEMGNYYPVGNYCGGTMDDKMVGGMLGEFEESKGGNYWEELLDLVNMSPTLM